MSQQPLSPMPTLAQPAPASPRPEADPLSASGTVLCQLGELVAQLDDDQYARKPVGTFGGSVGGHVRHCLDHAQALITGTDQGLVDYDQRERGTAIETDRAAAVRKITELNQRLSALADRPMGEPLTVAVMLSGDGASTYWQTTLGRESAFVLSHTIHHCAMLGAMVRTMGVEVPEHFGLAPSTIAAGAGAG